MKLGEMVQFAEVCRLECAPYGTRRFKPLSVGSGVLRSGSPLKQVLPKNGLSARLSQIAGFAMGSNLAQVVQCGVLPK